MESGKCRLYSIVLFRRDRADKEGGGGTLGWTCSLQGAQALKRCSWRCSSSWRSPALAVPEARGQCPEQGAVTLAQVGTEGPFPWNSPVHQCSFFLGHLAHSDRAVSHLCYILALITVQKQQQ